MRSELGSERSRFTSRIAATSARSPEGHISAAKRHQKINIGGPRPDALELDQRAAGVVVVERRKAVRIELARHDRLCERADVRALLPRQPSRAKLSLAQRGDTLGRDVSGEALQAAIRRASCR
jgi:hypothetical protein